MSDKLEVSPMTEAEIAACTLLDEIDARFTSPTKSAEAELVLSRMLAELERLAAENERLHILAEASVRKAIHYQKRNKQLRSRRNKQRAKSDVLAAIVRDLAETGQYWDESEGLAICSLCDAACDSFEDLKAHHDRWGECPVGRALHLE